jgi:hypothetical protein
VVYGLLWQRWQGIDVLCMYYMYGNFYCHHLRSKRLHFECFLMCLAAANLSLVVRLEPQGTISELAPSSRHRQYNDDFQWSYRLQGQMN